MDNGWKLMGEKLPKQPCEDLCSDILVDICDADALGQSLILYHREPVELCEPVKDVMDPEDWERRARTAKRRWGARCTCTHCGDDFLAGYKKGGGIVLAEGPDGQTYDGYAEPGPDANKYFDGETLICPHCWQEGALTRRAGLRKGRTYQVLQAETINVEDYTVVMYWLVSRRLDDTGADGVLFLPHSALLVDREGKLRRFSAKRTGQDVRDVIWIPRTYARDPMQMPYYSWEGASGRKVGGWTCGYGPDLEGRTGEKTALDKYIGAGGLWPGAYLHLWQKHPQVENLMRQGFASAVTGEIDQRLDNAACWSDLCDTPVVPWVDWGEVKPHRMLHMSKEAFREIRRKRWSAATASCWDRYRRQLGAVDALEFQRCCDQITVEEIEGLLDMVAAGWEDLRPARVVRYLEKQGLLADGVQHLIDYRKMLRDMGIAETEETLWPRDLMAAHDRVAQNLTGRFAKNVNLGFSATYVRLKPLEWTDGALCIVIPRAEQQLVDEGNVLRHCVGSYGSAHCSGKPVFFVRHYRRPERSYYTLQMDLTGFAPREVQLHGYGNERHGPKKQYSHKIPREVREFCNRWEREVLAPWFKAQPKDGAREKQKKRKKEKRAA